MITIHYFHTYHYQEHITFPVLLLTLNIHSFILITPSNSIWASPTTKPSYHPWNTFQQIICLHWDTLAREFGAMKSTADALCLIHYLPVFLSPFWSNIICMPSKVTHQIQTIYPRDKFAQSIIDSIPRKDNTYQAQYYDQQQSVHSSKSIIHTSRIISTATDTSYN